jgi:uncharacterized protein (DUF1778 family)
LPRHARRRYRAWRASDTFGTFTITKPRHGAFLLPQTVVVTEYKSNQYKGLTMTIVNATIMFTNEETEMISECAKRRGLSFQEFVRQSALEKVEDALDKQSFENAIAMDDGQHYNTRQVMRMAIMEP